MNNYVKRMQFFALVILLGMQIIIGFLVIPIMFKHIKESISPLSIENDRNYVKKIKVLQKNIVGHLLHYVSYTSIVTIIIILFTDIFHKSSIFYSRYNKRNYLIILALILVVLNEFLITPILSSIALNTSHWLQNIFRWSFHLWHIIYNSIFRITVMICLVFAFLWSKAD